jgi:vancomycin permeability regulator SanA
VSGRGSLPGRIFGVLALLLFMVWVSFVVAIVDAGRRDDTQHADAIIVLGAAQYEGRPSPVLKARLDHAAELWSRGLAPMMIVTGGQGVGDTTSEAAVGRRYLIQHSVPADRIEMDTAGLTTSQSMIAAREFLKTVRPTVLVVSDPFHMLRLAILARRLRMNPLLSPTRTSPISARLGQRLRYILAESFKAPYALLIGVR